jgi:hypothetical protein
VSATTTQYGLENTFTNTPQSSTTLLVAP